MQHQQRSWLREKPEEVERTGFSRTQLRKKEGIARNVAGFVRSRKKWKEPGSHEPSYERKRAAPAT